MKKWFAGLAVLLILLVTCLYIFIPGKLAVSRIIAINATKNGALRCLSDKANWEKWWPATKDSTLPKGLATDQDIFIFNGSTYRITQRLFRGFDLLIQSGDNKIESRITMQPISVDSVSVEWQCMLMPGLNPVKRLLDYRRAVEISNNLADLLERLRGFLEKKENIYSISIEQTQVKDTLLVTAKNISQKSSSMPLVYGLIKNLRDYISSQGAEETNYPMLNIMALDSTHFETLVAIPVNKELKGNGTISPKRMVPGNILVTEVRGGNYSINHAMGLLENYIDDYQKSRIAIPFESMVTDRSSETDTSQWVTKIYYPIIR
ncbi:MAG TPA: GyrI-like domain-containing protein [Puia sp.]|nr:GyrI-like domain-containing protein [Puia sp.]